MKILAVLPVLLAVSLSPMDSLSKSGIVSLSHVSDAKGSPDKLPMPKCFPHCD